ncbi:MAG: hypothetical protein AAGA96_10320 [Verrucomicrobiota bacterium]
MFKLAPNEVIRGQRRRILIVQGDWELGMSRLAQDLIETGHSVIKLALNAPDLMYRARGIKTIPFRKPIREFEEWLGDLVKCHEIDTFVVYNSFRPYNQVACQLADRLGLGVIQCEQGILRPLHVTVIFGSKFPFDEIRELWEDKSLRGQWAKPNPPDPVSTVSTARKNVKFGLSVLSALTLNVFFPRYCDQQRMSFSKHFIGTLLNGCRFLARSWESGHFTPLITGPWSGKFFLAPLQLGHDAQIQRHSPFKAMNEVMDLVANSFLENAEATDRLIFKIHPLDRGYRTFKEKFQEISERLGKERVFLVDRVDLSLLIENSKGVVTVNSTVGLIALRHQAKVKVLGEAFYDLPCLTFQGELNQFWQAPHHPKKEDVQQFINMLEYTMQARGTLSGKCFANAGHCGILWPIQVGKTLGLDYLLHPDPEPESDFSSEGASVMKPI